MWECYNFKKTQRKRFHILPLQLIPNSLFTVYFREITYWGLSLKGSVSFKYIF